MAKQRKYTDEQFIEAVKSSTSVRQVLSKLGLKEAGGNYAITKQRIKKLGLDISHFTGPAWNKGKKIGPKRPLEDYTSNKHPIISHRLKIRLLKEQVFLHQCSVCNLTEWLNKPIPLELDHINGNHEDNSIENLRLLCPNCHAQTDNYRGKNIGKT